MLLLFCAFAAPTLAQQRAADVTEAQIKEYKATAMGGCREAGKARGDTAESVDEFCSCMIGALEKSMTRAEWQQVYFLSRQNREKEELNVLGPHMTQIRACNRQR